MFFCGEMLRNKKDQKCHVTFLIGPLVSFGDIVLLKVSRIIWMAPKDAQERLFTQIM